MTSRYSLNPGEGEISKKLCNASPGKFSIWWSLLSLGLQRKELHQGWLVFTNQRLVFCKRYWLKQSLLGPLHSFIPSKRILWEADISQIESVSPRKCLGVFPIQRVRLNDDSGRYDFGYGNKNMKKNCDSAGINYVSS